MPDKAIEVKVPITKDELIALREEISSLRSERDRLLTIEASYHILCKMIRIYPEQLQGRGGFAPDPMNIIHEKLRKIFFDEQESER